jgi:methylenetetrahydrofolate/methylenetetrahydromethanopterin dehydrogenase (NADP+)
VKKILIQLDTDEHPSTFDAIVAHDADVDALLRYGGITTEVVKGLVQSAFFTRGPKDLATLAVWVGGSSVGDGEEVLAEVQKAFFGPFRVSAMLDSNGCNTTAATTVARLAREIDLKGRQAVVVGAGAVGLRAAALLVREGCDITVSGIPADRFGEGKYRRARGLSVAEERDLRIVEPADDDELAKVLDGASLVLAAGPAGIELLPESIWTGIDSIEVLADFNAAEPLGIEGTDANDDFAEHHGKRVLGALAIGGPKMKVHKACVRRLFETNDAILDVDGVYEIAQELGSKELGAKEGD